MSRIILLLTLFAAHPLLSLAQTTQPDMTVFGFKLGEKLSLPECKCKVVETTTDGYGLSAKHWKGYQYVDMFPAMGAGDCFERTDLGKYTVRKRDKLDSLQPVTTGNINVMFDPANTPKICALGKFYATLADSKLMAVVFTIMTNAADDVLETLKKKYGSNPAVKNYQVQNGYGATLNYYVAVWSFKNLRVMLQSSNHESLTDHFGTVVIEIPREVEAPKEKRPL